jgi:hypothetical protein
VKLVSFPEINLQTFFKADFNKRQYDKDNICQMSCQVVDSATIYLVDGFGNFQFRVF